MNDTIKRIFDGSGVYDLAIEMDSKSAQGEYIPVRVSFKGTLESGEQALNRIQKEFPYLSYREIGFSREGDTNVLKYDAVVNYRYKLVIKQSGR